MRFLTFWIWCHTAISVFFPLEWDLEDKRSKVFIGTVIRQRAGTQFMAGQATVHSSPWCKVPKSLKYTTEGGNGSWVKSNPELSSGEVKVPTTAPPRWPKKSWSAKAVAVDRCAAVVQNVWTGLGFSPTNSKQLAFHLKAGFRHFCNINPKINLKGLPRTEN